MTEFTYGGETLQIPRFKLREIRAAAPFLDRVMVRRKEVQELVGGASTPEEMAQILQDSSQGDAMSSLSEGVADIVRVIAVGVLHARGERPYDPTSIEAMAQIIEAEVGIEDLPHLNTALESILREAGMTPEGPPIAPVSGDVATTDSVLESASRE